MGFDNPKGCAVNRILIHLQSVEGRKQRQRDRIQATCESLKDRINREGIEFFSSRNSDTGADCVGLCAVLERRFLDETDDELPGSIASTLRAFADELMEAAAQLEGGAA